MQRLMRSRSYSSLPRLPVPDLGKTLDRYLTSIKPLLHDSGPSSFAEAYQVRKQWADEFHSGIGSVLQERLIALDKVSPNNWLDDNFWIQKAYHEWRAPLLVNSNWWLAFYDDNLIPESASTAPPENGMAGATTWQLRRAAWLIHRTLVFKDNLETQDTQSEITRTGIWLRDSTSKMFNIARIPRPGCDTLSIPPPRPHSLAARSILVMFRNFCYTIPVYSPTGELTPPKDIYYRLRKVVGDVDRRINSGEEAFPIGVLSADDRDMWAKNLSHLLSLSPENKASHDRLLASVMALSLDHESHELTSASFPSHPRSDSHSALDSHLHSIRSTQSNFSNRFFDKPYTILVDPLARAGATGEHSPCDALVPSIVAEYAIVEGVEEEAFDSAEAHEASTSVDDDDEGGFVRINWVADNKLWNECQEAKRRSLAVIQDSDNTVFWFQEYGTDWIKKFAKLSPDAYIQMALQLAWYRTRDSFTATYETVLTRMFKRGRTETLRSYTIDSRAWILAMSDPHLPVQQQYELLQKAISTHTHLTREAATGRGIDRHLLGLRLMLKPFESEPSLFTDALFSQSQEWKLSTSGLSAGHWFRGTGFGSPFNDGYGINYLAAPEMIKFGIESKFSSPLTSTYLFKNAIAEALEDMRRICQAGMVPIEEHPIRTHL